LLFMFCFLDHASNLHPPFYLSLLATVCSLTKDALEDSERVVSVQTVSFTSYRMC